MKIMNWKNYKVKYFNLDEVANLRDQLNGVEINTELFGGEENLDDIIEDDIQEEEKDADS